MAVTDERMINIRLLKKAIRQNSLYAVRHKCQCGWRMVAVWIKHAEASIERVGNSAWPKNGERRDENESANEIKASAPKNGIGICVFHKDSHSKSRGLLMRIEDKFCESLYALRGDADAVSRFSIGGELYAFLLLKNGGVADGDAM